MNLERAVLEKIEANLRDAVYVLTWAGVLWGPGGAIRLSRARSAFLNALGLPISADSALLSTYYTAMGNAAARVKERFLSRDLSGCDICFWALRAAWCFIKVSRLASRLLGRGIENLAPDQLDVLAAALERTFRRASALRCIEEAIGRWDVSPSSRMLLTARMGKILYIQHRAADARKAFDAVREAVRDGNLPPTVMARLCRALGEHCLRDRNPAAGYWLRAAERIAREHNLGDQLVKIEPLITAVTKK